MKILLNAYVYFMPKFGFLTISHRLKTIQLLLKFEDFQSAV